MSIIKIENIEELYVLRKKRKFMPDIMFYPDITIENILINDEKKAEEALNEILNFQKLDIEINPNENIFNTSKLTYS